MTKVFLVGLLDLIKFITPDNKKGKEEEAAENYV